MSANYSLGISYYNQAERYASTAEMLFEHGVCDHTLLIEAQIAHECYLCAILEATAKRPVQDIFGKGRVPHDPGRLIHKIFYFESRADFHHFQSALATAQNSGITIKRDAIALYDAYKAARYPSPHSKRLTNEKDAADAIKTIRNMEKVAEDVLPRLLKFFSQSSPKITKNTPNISETSDRDFERE